MKCIIIAIIIAISIVILPSCEKKTDPVSSVVNDTTRTRFSDSNSVKIKSTYINLETGLTVTGSDTLNLTKWDIKLTRLDSVTIDQGLPFAMKLAGIVLGSTVKAKVVDSIKFENVSLDGVIGLISDNPPSFYAIGMKCFYTSETTRKYEVYNNRTFIVQTRNGKFVKIKLVSFYKNGISGYFTFDYLMKK